MTEVSEGKEQYGEVNNEIYSSTTLAAVLLMFSSSLLYYLLYFAILGKHKVTEVLNSDAMKYLYRMIESYFSYKENYKADLLVQ